MIKILLGAACGALLLAGCGDGGNGDLLVPGIYQVDLVRSAICDGMPADARARDAFLGVTAVVENVDILTGPVAERFSWRKVQFPGHPAWCFPRPFGQRFPQTPQGSFCDTLSGGPNMRFIGPGGALMEIHSEAFFCDGFLQLGILLVQPFSE